MSRICFHRMHMSVHGSSRKRVGQENVDLEHEFNDRHYCQTASFITAFELLRETLSPTYNPENAAHPSISAAEWREPNEQAIEQYKFARRRDEPMRSSYDKSLTCREDRLIFAKYQGKLRSMCANSSYPPPATYLKPDAFFYPLATVEDPSEPDFLATQLRQNLLNTPAPHVHDSKSPGKVSVYDMESHVGHYLQLPDSGWFRLLIVQPAEFGDPILCQLIPMKREQAAAQYETLSYSWRNENFRSGHGQIICNGSDMAVTSNLELALRHIRRPDRPRILWVDAICICQQDKEERSQQVQIMGSIYAQSFRTIIWLGQAEADIAKSAFDKVRKLVDTWRGDQETSRPAVSDESAEDGTDTVDSDNVDDSRSWDALEALYGCDWFKRKWVIQEVANSKSLQVVWGQWRISWSYIGVAAAILRTQHNRRVDEMKMFGVYNAYLMFRLRREGSLDPLVPSFLQLIRLTKHFKTTEYLDYAYALLGICTTDNIPEKQPFMAPDYTTDSQTATIRIVEKLLKDRIGQFKFPFKGPGYQIGNSLDFQPSKGLPFRRCTGGGIPSTTLAVDGILFSSIIWAHDLVPDWTANIRSILRYLDTGAFGEPSTSILALLSHTLRAGGNAYGSRDGMSKALTAAFSSAISQSDTEYSESSWIELARDTAKGYDPDDFFQAADRVCPTRAIFVTTGGHIGLAPYATVVGDVVGVLAGADMPVVLRQVERGPKYAFVGQCFIDNVMEGEVVEASKHGEGHTGPFDPALLLDKLHDFSALTEEAQEKYAKMADEILERATAVYGNLKVEVVQIL